MAELSSISSSGSSRGWQSWAELGRVAVPAPGGCLGQGTGDGQAALGSLRASCSPQLSIRNGSVAFQPRGEAVLGAGRAFGNAHIYTEAGINPLICTFPPGTGEQQSLKCQTPSWALRTALAAGETPQESLPDSRKLQSASQNPTCPNTSALCPRKGTPSHEHRQELPFSTPAALGNLHSGSQFLSLQHCKEVN